MAIVLPERPNIIVINCDDAPLNFYSFLPLMQANWLPSFCDYTRNGSANEALCAPGRAATLTGLRVAHHRVFDNGEGASCPFHSTLLTAAKSQNYFSGALSKWMNGFGEGGGFGAQVRQPGCDWQRIIWGNPNYFDYDLLDELGALTHYGKRTSQGGNDNNYITRVELVLAEAFVTAALAAGKKFCLYWGAKCPHKDSGDGATPDPLDENTVVNNIPVAGFGVDPRVYGNPQWMVDTAVTPWNDAAVARIVLEHKLALQSMLSFDRTLNAFMTFLNGLGLLANTFIFLKTDNAHAYGEFRQDAKGTPHRSASSMLLQVRCPTGMGLSGARNQAVSDIDICPTVCKLIGGRTPIAPDGMSFDRTFESNLIPFRAAAPLDNPTKDSPTYTGLWYESGVVWYRGIKGGKAQYQFGGWRDRDQLQDIGYQAACDADLTRITKATYPYSGVGLQT